MFRYVLALLLINAYYCTLGIPTPSIAPKHQVSASLNYLAEKCENTFLSNQMKSKIKDCEASVPPNSEKQFQCLMFYDMNYQLCAAFNLSKLVLSEDYIAKINEEEDVNSLCIGAKDWALTNFTEYPYYKVLLEKALKHSVQCGRLCSVEDFASDDANFFCKYYKWGNALLKSQITTSTLSKVDQPDVAPVLGDNTANNNVKPEISAPSNAGPTDVQVKTKEQSTSQINTSVKNDASTKTKEVIIESGPETSSSKLVLQPQVPVPEKNDEADVNVKVDEPLVDNVNVLRNQADKAPVEEAPNKSDLDGEVQLNNAEKKVGNKIEKKEPVLENPHPLNNDDMEYPDSEGDNDNQGGDDGEDPLLAETNIKQDLKQKDTVLRVDSMPSFSGDLSRSVYPNSIPDDYAVDDDDHFFSFFLTAVILVVLLYVLYHNKNKVSKVFFGLVLEGRQSGRRRNSRGHSYRRLDTLEQAMSANTAAPPSKIIY